MKAKAKVLAVKSPGGKLCPIPKDTCNKIIMYMVCVMLCVTVVCKDMCTCVYTTNDDTIWELISTFYISVPNTLPPSIYSPSPE